MSYESNAGTYYVPLTCGIPTAGGVDPTLNRGTYYVGNSANDFILWGQDTHYTHVQSNSGSRYYFYQCDVPSDIITTPASLASAILNFGVENYNNIVHFTTTNVGASANRNINIFSYTSNISSVEYYAASSYSFTETVSSIDIKIPFGNQIILVEEEGNIISIDNGDGSSTIVPTPFIIDFAGFDEGRPYWATNDYTVVWEDSMWKILYDGLLYYSEENVFHPTFVSTWTAGPLLSTGNVVAMPEYSSIPNLVNYINNNTSSIKLSAEIIESSTIPSFGSGNYTPLVSLSGAEDSYEIPFGDTNAGTHYYYSSAFNCVSFCDPIDTPHY